MKQRTGRAKETHASAKQCVLGATLKPGGTTDRGRSVFLSLQVLCSPTYSGAGGQLTV